MQQNNAVRNIQIKPNGIRNEEILITHWVENKANASRHPMTPPME